MDADGSSDFFAQLQEQWIIEILSLLPLEDAIRTSLLSRRWRHLWKHVYNLKYEPEWGLEKFKKFLDRYQCEKVRKFEATLKYEEIIQGLTSLWLNIILNRQVEELILSSWCFGMLPRAVLRSNSLVSLTLSNLQLQLPTSVCLCSLKILDLAFIYLDSNMVKELISNSPVLASLSISQCLMPDKLEIFAESLHLKSLRVINTGRGIRIHAPHVEFLQLMCGELLQYGCLLIDMSSLVEVRLLLNGVASSCMSGNASEHFSNVLKGILDEIKHVKRLYICDRSIQVHSAGKIGILPHQFINLTYLELDCDFKDVGQLRGTANFLSKCPNLQTLVLTLKKGVSFCAQDEGLRSMLEYVFSQVLTHLKSVKVNGFAGSLREIALATNPLEKINEILETVDGTFEFQRILLTCSKSLEALDFTIDNKLGLQSQNQPITIASEHVVYFQSEMEQKWVAYCATRQFL